MKHFGVMVVTVMLALGAGTLASAATLTVTNSADSGAGSLRNTIAAAVSGDTIGFNLTYPATITLASTLTINKNLTIVGPGSSRLTVSGNNAVRVFDVTSGMVTISGITVSNGYVNGIGESGAGFRLRRWFSPPERLSIAWARL